MTPDATGAASREARRQRRLGPNPVCIGCGVIEPRILEVHHRAGEANAPELTEIRCCNCHRLITTQHADLGVDMAAPETLLHKIIAMLGGIGATLIAIGETLLGLAQQLQMFLEALDTNPRFHGWRELPAATP